MRETFVFYFKGLDEEMKPGGYILHGVNAHVNFFSKKCGVKLLGEKDHITLCLHDANFNCFIYFQFRVIFHDKFKDKVRLSESKS